jgi:hypothetical protein
MLTFSKKKKSPVKSILGFSVMVAAMSSILFMNSRPIDVESVKSRLQRLTDTLSAQAESANKTASLTYGSIELKGVGYEKFIEISSPVFKVTDKDDASKSTILETSKITVNYDPINDKRFVFKIPEPISYTKNGKQTVFRFDKSLKLGYFQKDFANPNSDSLLTIRLPSDVSWEYVSPKDPSSKVTSAVNFETMPEINIKNSISNKSLEEKFELHNISQEEGEKDKSNIGAVAHSISEITGEDNRISGAFNFTVSDFIHQLDTAQARTCSLTSNISYSSTESLMNLVGLPVKADVDAKLNKLVLSCDDFTVKIDGDVTRLASDDMLSGSVNVSIDNLKPFMVSDIFSTKTRNELVTAMPKITGKPNDAQQEVSFVVKREKNGPLMLGAASLEDTGLSFMKDSAQDEPEQALLPEAKAPVDAKASAPVQRESMMINESKPEASPMPKREMENVPAAEEGDDQ